MSENIAVRPIPTIQGEAREFWEACARHELVLQRCRSCGEYQFYPRALCRRCWGTDLDWVPSEGRGEIYTFTVVHRAPTDVFQAMTPYVVALVALREGVRLLSHVVGAAPEDVSIGAEVKVAFDDITPEVSLPVFELV
jgi:uncharacterized OB-fold protein